MIIMVWYWHKNNKESSETKKIRSKPLLIWGTWGRKTSLISGKWMNYLVIGKLSHSKRKTELNLTT